MGLFDLFAKKNSFGQRMDRLTRDGELPYGWICENRDFTQKTSDEYSFFLDEYISQKDKGFLKKYAALKSLVVYMEDIKRISESKGECFAEWAKIHVANPDSLADFKKELKYMEDHKDEILQLERLTKKFKTDLPKIIKSEPGILQTEIYKRFDPEHKTIISDVLYRMAREGVITREKAGRTYSLYPKG